MSNLNRRTLLKSLMASFGGLGTCGILPALAETTAGTPKGKSRHCVLLWMNGGPTQTDTFDMKPEHANGGEFKPIATSAKGLEISEHFPKLARHGHQLAVLRGLSTREGDHGRGTFTMHMGRQPDPLVRFPTLGAMLSKELAQSEAMLPEFVAVNPYLGFDATAWEAGFLGARFAPLTIKSRAARQVTGPASAAAFAELGVDDLKATQPVSAQRASDRLGLLQGFQSQLVAESPQSPVLAHDTMLQRAIQLVSSDAGKVFDLSQESAATREKYGRGSFGQGCLLARRLIEKGVSFVEVSLGDSGRWDTHGNNFATVRELSTELDAGWSALLDDLEARGLLESTTILWMGEFGRTPKINGGAGRDHFPNAWSAVLAGGGIRGGQTYGRTSIDGMTVESGKMDVGDLFATLCGALQIDHRMLNTSNIGRPFRIAEGQPVKEVLG